MPTHPPEHGMGEAPKPPAPYEYKPFPRAVRKDGVEKTVADEAALTAAKADGWSEE